MRTGASLLAALSSALVAMATMIQMWIDWHQMPRSESLDLRLRVAIAAAGFLTLLALILGLYTASRAKRR